MDLGVNRARDMLQSAATIEIVSAEIVLDAQNNPGHKAATSYPLRCMWINFKVTDSNNNVVFESGEINADGSIPDADKDVNHDQNNAVFEPHYNLVYTLLRGARYLVNQNIRWITLRLSTYLDSFTKPAIQRAFFMQE